MTTPVNLGADATKSLQQLVELLFPDPNPDILTLCDFKNRYPFTQLGELATQAIEKSQRINNRRGNYQHIGLCEFHIGLIFFFSGKYRGARQQFTLARQQWSFVYEPAAEALAYFAEGVAHQLAHHYEAAMSNYSKAKQRLSRIKFAPPSQAQNEFVMLLSELLQHYQGTLHHKLWPEEKADDPADALTASTADTVTPPQVTPPYPAASLANETAVPPTEPAGDTNTQTDTAAAPPPIVTYPTETTPIPDHEYVGADYEWYLIEKQPEPNIFPEIVQKGTFVLVDKSAKNADALMHSQSKAARERIIILANEELGGQNGRITVRPVRRTQHYPRIYLGLLNSNEPNPIAGFEQTPAQPDNFSVTLSHENRQMLIQLNAILGIVRGFWTPIEPTARQ